MDDKFQDLCDEIMRLIRTNPSNWSVGNESWTKNALYSAIGASKDMFDTSFAILMSEDYIEPSPDVFGIQVFYTLTDKGLIFYMQGGYHQVRFREYQRKKMADEIEQIRQDHFRMEQTYMNVGMRTNRLIVLWTCVAGLGALGQLIVASLEKLHWAGTIQFLSVAVISLIAMLVGIMITLLLEGRLKR